MNEPADASLFDRLDVWDDPLPRDGALNMALDEALLGSLGDRPLLRVYRWERPTVSFGYFEPWRAVAERYPGQALVRRWTGGGVVEHGEDVTYSLLVPRSHPVTNLRAGECYRRVHLALQACGERLGWGRGELSAAADPTDPAALRVCFDLPVQYDLLQRGRKIGGAAQRRTRVGLLHQGSVLPPPSMASDVDIFARTLAATFSNACASWAPSGTVLANASGLAASKYAAEAWTRRC